MLTTETLFERLKNIKVGANVCQFSREKCAELVPIINEINQLKSRLNAVILAHSYVSPEIMYGISDFSGDSYELSKSAQSTKADMIIFCAVKFMAETAKILNPEKRVLIPSKNNGCTLADAITGAQTRALRKKYPDYTFVCYINTSADVKAECDVCVTSSNVYNIVQALPNDKIFFLPDRLMGQNLKDEMQKRGIKKEIAVHDGVCYVHEKYDEDMIAYMRMQHPETKVLSHPECNSGVLRHSDFVGSTSQMINYVRQSDAAAFFLLTECGLSGRLQLELPDKKFVGSCTLCKYMKANTLPEVLRVMKKPDPDDEIVLEESVRVRALQCINEMFRYADGAKHHL